MNVRGALMGLAVAWGLPALAATPEEVLALDARLLLEPARHTPTYSPPVASRTFAYVGIAAYEATASGPSDLVTLAGQLPGLDPLPAREAGAHDEAAVLQAVDAAMIAVLFANTGPTGQRAMDAVAARLSGQVAEGLDPAVLARSRAHGEAVAAHVLAWAATDGGAVVDNMGFPLDHPRATEPGAWVPTSTIVQQQAPLLPLWGENRAFAMPDGAACPLPPPLPYSEEADSPFRLEAEEVVAVRRDLTDDQRAAARFWSDDPMLSPTPPGHWMAIADAALADAPAERRVEVMALLGIALADSFIACWHEKFAWNTIRPVTYIRAHLDPAFEPLLVTPPFPEYPSGHSTQSGAAATVLTVLLGESPFTDRTHEADGLPARSFDNFWAAAEEAGMSRLYGGIHFRAAVERGLDQGRCVGAHALTLRTRP